MALRKSSRESLRKYTIDEYRKFSLLLDGVISYIVNRDVYDVKYQAIFIEINNKLYDILKTNEFQSYPIKYLLIGFENKIAELNNFQQKPEIFKNLCIQFGFLLHDLNALFPNGIHVLEFKLDEEKAEQWWIENFDIAIFVEVDKFWKAFSEKFTELKHINCVLQSICFTNSDYYGYINKNSFNLFLRFYGGWDKLEEFWLAIYHHSANLHMVTLESAIDELEKVRVTIKTYRTIKKSYVFCINWRYAEGLWNLIYGDEDEIIKCSLYKAADMLNELQNTNKYEFPKGTEIAVNMRRFSQCARLLRTTKTETTYETCDPKNWTNSHYDKLGVYDDPTDDVCSLSSKSYQP